MLAFEHPSDVPMQHPLLLVALVLALMWAPTVIAQRLLPAIPLEPVAAMLDALDAHNVALLKGTVFGAVDFEVFATNGMGARGRIVLPSVKENASTFQKISGGRVAWKNS